MWLDVCRCYPSMKTVAATRVERGLLLLVEGRSTSVVKVVGLL